MLKSSRAYLCHTVAEGSPLNKVASNLFSQARQTLENVFRRTGRVVEGIPKQPGLKQFGGRASSGVFAQIHANSRGLITKFTERNHTSELINAMKKKYRWSGGFRSGVWGQKLSTFAFVGIGVAAGAQWKDFEEQNFLLQDINFLEFFGKSVDFAVLEKPACVEEPETLPLHAEFELDMPLNLSEYDSEETEPSFVLLDNLSFDAAEDESAGKDDIQSTAQESFDVTQQVAVSSKAMVEPFHIVDEKEVGSLMEQLNISLARVQEQREELESLCRSVTQLNELLYDLVGPSTPDVVSIGPSFLEIEILIMDDTSNADLKERLMRNLSVIDQQQLQLTTLRHQMLIQNQQLQDLCEAAAVHPTFSKRDACYGSGAPEAW